MGLLRTFGRTKKNSHNIYSKLCVQKLLEFEDRKIVLRYVRNEKKTVTFAKLPSSKELFCGLCGNTERWPVCRSWHEHGSPIYVHSASRHGCQLLESCERRKRCCGCVLFVNVSVRARVKHNNVFHDIRKRLRHRNREF